MPSTCFSVSLGLANVPSSFKENRWLLCNHRDTFMAPLRPGAAAVAVETRLLSTGGGVVLRLEVEKKINKGFLYLQSTDGGTSSESQERQVAHPISLLFMNRNGTEILFPGTFFEDVLTFKISAPHY